MKSTAARKKPATAPNDVEAAATAVASLEQLAIEAAGATVASLNQRLAPAEDQKASIAPRRKVLAFEAHDGNEEAAAALSALNAEEMDVDFRIKSLRDAVDEARRREVVARRHADTADDEKTLAEAKELADDLLKIAAEFDAALALVANLRDRREVVISRLLDKRCLPPHARLGFGGPERTDEAIRAAGLQNLYNGSRYDNSNGARKLAEIDREVASKLQLPSAVAKMRSIF